MARHCQTFLSLPTLFVLLAVSAVADDKKPPPDDLDPLLRKLEKDISQVRGLEFKAPVKAKFIQRDEKADKSIQGYYKIEDKTLYLYEDVKGSYKRGVLIHEMVHALQDQHFNLKKLHQKQFDNDTELALAALIEGDATFTMIEVIKKDQPRVAEMLESPLEKSGNLQNSFLYAQGARYVKAIKERDGWKAVNNAYRFSPQTTAEILHPGERINTIDLGPGKGVGELGLIRMLVEDPGTKAMAVKAAAGWRADRAIEEGGSKAWIVAFGDGEQATRFLHALAQATTAKNPELKQLRKDASGEVWQTSNKGVRSLLLRGSRVLSLEASDQAAYQKLLDRVTGPAPMEIHSSRQKRSISFGEMLDELMAADVICVGESHDCELHHQVQLQIIKSLFARDERLGVGMEMFQRPYQKDVDQYFQGKTSEEDFLKSTEYQKRWGFEWGLYRPIVEFCRKNGVPLAALNVATELRKRLSSVGHDKLTEDEKKQLGSIDFQVKDHRDYWYERLATMHGPATNVTPEQKERGYQVMTTWDEYMAASAAEFQQQRQLRRMVVLAGSGHIDHGFGIPNRTVKRTGGKVVTIKIESGEKPEKSEGKPVADFIIQVR
jgi:uncharacterized iron-regulated protein